MTTYICKCGRRVKKSTDASTTGNRLSGYAPGHECWGCPYAMPYGDFQWDESARTVSRETRGYECRMSKTLTYASEFAGSIKDKCTCRVHSLDFDFLSQVSAWIKDTYPDREIFGSFSKDIRAQRQRRPSRRAGRMQAHRPPRHPCRTANRPLPHRRAVLLYQQLVPCRTSP